MTAIAADVRREAPGADYTDFAHTGPGTLAGRYMRMFWHPVYLGRDLQPGRAVPIRIMSEDFTLYRGELPLGEGGGERVSTPSPTLSSPGGGNVHLLAFRCAHRGTQLSTGWVEGDNLRCFYHGWMYDSTGQCVEQPAEPEPFSERIRIRSYPIQEYLGLIFAYLGEGEPPPLPRYRPAEQPGVIDTWRAIVPCNYFNSLENDPLHTYFVHRRPGHDWRDWNGDVPMVVAEETDFGTRTYKVQSDGKPTGIGYKGMPNIVARQGSLNVEQWGGGSSTALVWKVPIDDERHWRIGLDVVHLTGEVADRYRERRDQALARMDLDPTELAERVLAGELAMSDIDRSRVYMVNVEDDVSQAGQGAIVDRQAEHLGRSDSVVVLFRQIWSREMRAVAEGRPIKRWTPPDQFFSAE